MSDAVEAGETFAVYGEGFDDETQIYVEGVTSASPSETPTTQNLCEIISIDEQGQTVTCKMPEELSNGTYNLWATNRYGMSVANELNTVRPKWLSHDAVAPGMTFKVMGNNMTSDAYSSGNRAYAVLVGENNTYDLQIISKNEYAIELKCPIDIKAGEYDVYVSNDGIVWNKPEDNRKLTVTEPVNDKYGINEAWASEFNFDKIVEASLAVPNDGKDDSWAIELAVNATASAGGGVVLLEEGVYEITEPIRLKSNVVLAGAGMDKTILNYNEFKYYSHGYPVIGMYDTNDEITDWYAGVYGLTIKDEETEEDAIASPDEYVIMSGHTFLKNVKIDAPMLPDLRQLNEDGTPNNNKSRGLGVLIGGGHNVIDGCVFEGYNVQPTHSTAKEYVKITNNVVDTAVGVFGIVATYATIENNKITRHYGELPEGTYKADNASGIFTRGPSYIYNNTIKNTGFGNVNDGEIICIENYRGGYKLVGDITAVDETGTTVTVEPFDDINSLNYHQDWTLLESTLNRNYLIVTEGRGAGQYIAVTDYDEEAKTITLEKPFEILPNKDSRFMVAPVSTDVIFYKNYGENARKGFWLYYDCIDCTIAENTGINTEGILLRSVYAETDESYANTVMYFSRIDGNYFEGNSVASNMMGIDVMSSVEGTNPRNLNTYGVEIKNNILINKDTPQTVVGGYTEDADLNGIAVVYPVRWEGTPIYTVMKQVIVEGNTIQDSDRGITVSHDQGDGERLEALGNMTSEVYIGDNNFINVDSQITDDR